MTPVGPLAVAAPPRVRDRLRDTPDGQVTVVHRGAQAVYVDLGGWCVGVVSRTAARLPCALRAAVDPLPGALSYAGGPAHVESGTLHVGGSPLPIGRLEETCVPRLALDVVLGAAADAATVAALPGASTVSEFAAAQLPRHGIDADVAAHLIGRGEGLTPLGDDLLAGWLALHRAAGVATAEVDDVVRSHAPRTTLLSATLLDCAVNGEVVPEFASWVGALGGPDVESRAAALAAVGATSGAGLLRGAHLALTQLQIGLQEAAPT
ncbi:MAG: oxamate carbamoyltransferase subunit AllH family protein [Nocardioides sp.]